MKVSSKHLWYPITVPPDASVVEAADSMDVHGVGCVVVADADGKPVGILTDRDLTCRVVGADRDPERIRVADVMTPNPLTAHKDALAGELLDIMERHAIRRVPLVEDGRVVGLVSYDDIVLTLAVQLWNISEGIREGLRESWRTSTQRRRREAREELLEDLRDRLANAGSELRARAASELRGLAEALEKRRRD